VAAVLVLIAISVIVMARAHASDAAAVTVPPRGTQPATRSAPGDRAATTQLAQPLQTAGAVAVATAPVVDRSGWVLGQGSPSIGRSAPMVGQSGPMIGQGGSVGVVVVDVTGRVHRPGVVRLPTGARVWDAVVAAGGASSQARLESLNLARPLSDGEQIRVPGPGDPTPADPGVPVAGGPVGGATGPSPVPVDLNTATSADLDGLPGVGPVLAGRILSWRSQHGRFTRVEELGEVQGIGQKLFASLRPLVRV
jgi:competence protein ComEA